MIFPTVFHRNLACGHTHLYTDASLNWLCREFGFNRVAEWWFGTDVVDWYRSVMVRARQQPETARMADEWADLWAPAIDGLVVAAESVGIPLKVLDVIEDAARDLYERDLAIIRPDQHVAWRGNQPPDDPEALWATITGH